MSEIIPKGNLFDYFKTERRYFMHEEIQEFEKPILSIFDPKEVSEEGPYSDREPEFPGNRVTLECVARSIRSVSYARMGKKTTTCFIVMKNGHEVIGSSGCVDPANYDEETGKKIAYSRAESKVWAALGGYLQQRIYETSKE
jgi:hypothetical protein